MIRVFVHINNEFTIQLQISAIEYAILLTHHQVIFNGYWFSNLCIHHKKINT